jgi:hypothetical protein
MMNFDLEHDGGTHQVEIEFDQCQAVIRFGSSFTLRINEPSADKLRKAFFIISRELQVRKAIENACNVA